MTKCPGCGVEFEPLNGRTKYCEPACAIKNQYKRRVAKGPTRPAVPCRGCKTPFKPKHGNSQYCDECRAKNGGANNEQRKYRDFHDQRVAESNTRKGKPRVSRSHLFRQRGMKFVEVANGILAGEIILVGGK